MGGVYVRPNKRRMAPAHDSGRVNACRNLPRRETGDEDGPKLPRASERFRRKVIAMLWYGYTKWGDLVGAAKGKPYVARRRKAYCM